MANISKAKRAKFIKEVIKGLIALGAVEDTDASDSTFQIFDFPTIAGNLVIKVDLTQSGLHSVFSRFEDYEKAVDCFPELELNPKYNFHGLDKPTVIEDAISHFKRLQKSGICRLINQVKTALIPANALLDSVLTLLKGREAFKDATELNEKIFQADVFEGILGEISQGFLTVTTKEVDQLEELQFLTSQFEYVQITMI